MLNQQGFVKMKNTTNLLFVYADFLKLNMKMKKNIAMINC